MNKSLYAKVIVLFLAISIIFNVIPVFSIVENGSEVVDINSYFRDQGKWDSVYVPGNVYNPNGTLDIINQEAAIATKTKFYNQTVKFFAKITGAETVMTAGLRVYGKTVAPPWGNTTGDGYYFWVTSSAVILYRKDMTALVSVKSATVPAIGDSAQGADYEISAIDQSDGGVLVSLKINGVDVISYKDVTNPIKSSGSIYFSKYGLKTGSKVTLGHVLDLGTLLSSKDNWDFSNANAFIFNSNKTVGINNNGETMYTKKSYLNETVRFAATSNGKDGEFVFGLRVNGNRTNMPWNTGSGISGYFFCIDSSNSISLYKGGSWGSALATVSDLNYRQAIKEAATFEFYAVNLDFIGVQIVLMVDGRKIIDYTDSANPLKNEGSLWFGKNKIDGPIVLGGFPVVLDPSKYLDIFDTFSNINNFIVSDEIPVLDTIRSSDGTFTIVVKDLEKEKYEGTSIDLGTLLNNSANWDVNWEPGVKFKPDGSVDIINSDCRIVTKNTNYSNEKVQLAADSYGKGVSVFLGLRVTGNRTAVPWGGANGYFFWINGSGTLMLYKNNMNLLANANSSTTHKNGITNYEASAIQEGNNVRIKLFLNGIMLINYLDNSSPITNPGSISVGNFTETELGTLNIKGFQNDTANISTVQKFATLQSYFTSQSFRFKSTFSDTTKDYVVGIGVQGFAGGQPSSYDGLYAEFLPGDTGASGVFARLMVRNSSGYNQVSTYTIPDNIDKKAEHEYQIGTYSFNNKVFFYLMMDGNKVMESNVSKETFVSTRGSIYIMKQKGEIIKASSIEPVWNPEPDFAKMVALAGTLKDEQGNPVGNATVKIENADKDNRTAITNTNGYYILDDFFVGNYTMTVSDENAKILASREISVAIGDYGSVKNNALTVDKYIKVLYTNTSVANNNIIISSPATNDSIDMFSQLASPTSWVIGNPAQFIDDTVVSGSVENPDWESWVVSKNKVDFVNRSVNFNASLSSLEGGLTFGIAGVGSDNAIYAPWTAKSLYTFYITLSGARMFKCSAGVYSQVASNAYDVPFPEDTFYTYSIKLNRIDDGTAMISLMVQTDPDEDPVTLISYYDRSSPFFAPGNFLFHGTDFKIVPTQLKNPEKWVPLTPDFVPPLVYDSLAVKSSDPEIVVSRNIISIYKPMSAIDLIGIIAPALPGPELKMIDEMGNDLVDITANAQGNQLVLSYNNIVLEIFGIRQCYNNFSFGDDYLLTSGRNDKYLTPPANEITDTPDGEPEVTIEPEVTDEPSNPKPTKGPKIIRRQVITTTEGEDYTWIVILAVALALAGAATTFILLRRRKRKQAMTGNPETEPTGEENSNEDKVSK